MARAIPDLDLLPADGLPLQLIAHAQHPQTQLHRHRFAELVLVLGGSGEHRTAAGAWPLARGDVFLIPVGMVHGYARVRNLALVNILYDPQRLALPLAALTAVPGYHALVALEPGLRASHGFTGHLRLDGPGLSGAERRLDLLREELACARPGQAAAATAALVGLLIHLARAYADAEPTTASAAVLRLGELLAWMEQHRHQPLHIADLERRSGWSRPTLQRLFRAALGQSPIRFQQSLRLDEAARRLADESDLGIAELARACGYADPGHFSRCFRRRHGLSPRRWRCNR